MIAGKNVKRYSKILLKALDAYSGSTAERVSDIIVSDETLLKMEELMKDNPTEQEIGQELSAGVKEKFSLDEDLDEDYDFTDEKAGAIHDTLKYSMDEKQQRMACER